MFALFVRSAATPRATPCLHVRCYTRRSVPTDINSYLMNFALAYLSQRSASEKHLEFVLRRRMTNLKFRSERAAESRAKFIKTQQVMGLKPTFPASRFPAKKVAENPESTGIASNAIDDAVNKVLTHFRSNGVLNDEKYSQKRASMLRAQSRSARYIQLDLTKKGIAPPLIQLAIDMANREKVMSAAVSMAEAGRADGVDGAELDTSEPFDDDGGEVATQADFLAALTLARKRKIGPFAPPTDAPDDGKWNADKAAQRQRALERLIRAGYSFTTAKRVLSTPAEVAADYFRRRG